MAPSIGDDPLAQALALANPRSDERVLDLSGRAGTVALRLSESVHSVEVLQPAVDLVEEGRRLAVSMGRRNLYFHAGHSWRLPFDDDQFNLCFWCLGLCRTGRPLATLAEIGRVLMPGGRLVLQDVLAFGSPSLDLKMWELERRRDPTFTLFYDEGQIDAMLESATGLNVALREHVAVTQDFAYWADVTDPGGLDELKRVFFSLPPADQDHLDLALADGRISFAYQVLTLLLRAT
jgi:SAM-dependent methyltransferase